MLVVATLSLKGGVGKTTVALGLAGAAHAHGVRTLVVDLDPQANATVALDAAATTATGRGRPRRPDHRRGAPRDRPQRLGRRAGRAGGRGADRAAQPPGSGRRAAGPALPRPRPPPRPGRPAEEPVPAGDRRLPAVAGPAHPQRACRRSAGPAGDRPDDVRRGRGAARLRRDPGRARAGAWQPGPAAAGRGDQPGAAAQQRARVPDRRAPRAVRAARVQQRAARPVRDPAGAGGMPADPTVGHARRARGIGGVHHAARPCAADNPRAAAGTGPDTTWLATRTGRGATRAAGPRRTTDGEPHPAGERGTGRRPAER